MKNILLKFLKNQTKCSHKNALLNTKSGYCPDCGQYLEKNYYIVRCMGCGIKRNAKVYLDEIVPTEKFCSNCGCRGYYIEKTDDINFIDANYAICIKEPACEYQNLHVKEQIWVDPKSSGLKKITKMS